MGSTSNTLGLLDGGCSTDDWFCTGGILIGLLCCVTEPPTFSIDLAACATVGGGKFANAFVSELLLHSHGAS